MRNLQLGLLALAIGSGLSAVTTLPAAGPGGAAAFAPSRVTRVPSASQNGSTGETSPQIVINSIGMKFAQIPPGKFSMGSPAAEPDREPKELPHEVVITQSYYLGVHEVTQAQYVEVMQGKDFQNRATFQSNRDGGPDHPMENVEWTLAQEFCKKLGERLEERRAGRRYRLPSEAEWEYACRAGTSTAFSFGNSLSSQQANFNGNFPAGDAERGPYLRRTQKVGSYPPNAFGLFDMHGNVAEWCADWYDPAYYADSPSEDPLGPPFGVVPTGFDGHFFVVVRGGSWVDDGRACRSAFRSRAMPATQYRLIGFRVVCEIESNGKGS